MSHPQTVVALAMVSLSSACGASKPPAGQGDSPAAPEPASAPAAPPPPEPTGPRDADDSDPAGLSALSTEDTNALDGQCKPFVEAVAKAAKKATLPKGAWESERMLAALEKPPKVKDVDEARCADLVRRDQANKRAKMAENDARMMLGTMHDMLGAAFKDTKKLCPATDPAPASLEATKALGGLETKQTDWPRGWSCFRFELWSQPSRWQYELKSNPGGGTFEIVARGYPVVGGPREELFLPGVVDAAGVAPKGAVKRR